MAANRDTTWNNVNVHETLKKFHDRKNDENGYDRFPGHQNQVDSEKKKAD